MAWPTWPSLVACLQTILFLPGMMKNGLLVLCCMVLQQEGYGNMTANESFRIIVANALAQAVFFYFSFDASVAILGPKLGPPLAKVFKWVSTSISSLYVSFMWNHFNHTNGTTSCSLNIFFSVAFCVGFFVVVYLTNSINTATNYTVENMKQRKEIDDLRAEVDSAKNMTKRLLAQKKKDNGNERVALDAKSLVGHDVFRKALEEGKTRVCEHGFRKPGDPCTSCKQTASLTPLEVAVSALGDQVAVGAL
jgi:hypothetical protein